MVFTSTSVISSAQKGKVLRDFITFLQGDMKSDLFTDNMLNHFRFFSGISLPDGDGTPFERYFGNKDLAKTTFDKMIRQSPMSGHPDCADLNAELGCLFSEYYDLVNSKAA